MMKPIQYLYSWFTSPTQIPDLPQYCPQHPSTPIQAICCNDFCSQHYICKFPGCLQKHKNHTTLTIQNYKHQRNVILKEINYHKKIEDMVRNYQSNFVKCFEHFMKKQIDKLLDEIDKKYFDKEVLEIFSKPNYYSFLANYKEGDGRGMQLQEYIKKQINLREKKIPNICKEIISSQCLRIDQSFLFNMFNKIQQIRQITSISKIQRIKQRLPFTCELIPRFTASVHKFSIQQLHKKHIRGPIVIVAQSYKKRIFGGFSMKMFPKQEKYVEDPRCQSLLFSLDDRITMKLKQQYKKYAIRGGQNLWFGRGDLAIANQCHKANISWAEIGRAYQVPKIAYGRESEWLGGAKYFRILEYQIFQVEFKGKKQ